MKVLIVGDIHWSTYSSILRSRGKKFSKRLECLIKSLNWVEQISKEYGCEEEVFLGDTFDKPDLTAEEISALSEVNWCSNPRIRHFIVGNHESDIASLEHNSTQILHKVGVIEDTPNIYPVDDATEFLFLPYITEDNRKPISEYMKNRVKEKNLIVFSHNDIKNFQMGAFLSKTGFDIDDIEANCALYINGHLHNGSWVTMKILNLGILCGQNFGEDASKYEHHVAILDTDTLSIEFVENPYAINFYKIDSEKNIGLLEDLKGNAVVSIRCESSLREALEKDLSKLNLLGSKVCYYNKIVNTESTVNITELQTTNHLEKFIKYVTEKLGKTEVVLEELSEVCK